jgi:hyperosmotically inducible periplasmic protein
MKYKLCAALLFVFVLAGTSLAKQNPVTDDSIVDQVRIKLANDDVVKGGALQVDVKQGVVTLAGSVEELKQKEKAERVAKKVKGVKQVINNITLRK